MKATITLLTLVLIFSLNIKCQEMNRDASTDLLKIVVDGGTQGFVDETYVHFAEGATTGYDQAIDAIKWYSIDPEATMIWTIASDNTELAINNLPLEDLHGILNTIPMTFVCGYGGGEYILTFSELDTFDESVEIWIEDQLTGEGWIGITPVENTYTFTALPEDAPGRFKIHILDPAAITGTEIEKKNSEAIKIYSHGNKIYINSENNIQIKEMMIFNISGQKVPFNLNYASPNLITIEMNERTGYYVIRLNVDNHYLSEKIFIKNF